jgi:hypothetical protein
VLIAKMDVTTQGALGIVFWFTDWPQVTQQCRNLGYHRTRSAEKGLTFRDKGPVDTSLTATLKAGGWRGRLPFVCLWLHPATCCAAKVSTHLGECTR